TGTTADATPLEMAFTTAAGREFLQVHESGGTEWFNKERYEELLEWLSIISIMERAATNPAARTIAAWLGSMATENQRLAELASHAGYRTTLLLSLLEIVEKGRETGKKRVPTRKPARKKTDVQGSARAQAAKAPHNKVPR